jgi:hypothetical protein
MPRRILKLVKERKLAQFIPPPAGSAVLEASGVVAKGGYYYIIFDNVRQIARVDRRLIPGSTKHGWFGRPREGDGYEDIAYSRYRRRFYLLIEAEKHPDGSYKALIDECDESGKFERRRWVEFAFEKRNTGFEGLVAVRRQREDYLLALCEGNRCRAGRRGEKPGGGRIHVLRKKGPIWEPIERIKLPRTLDFEDYSAVSLRGDRIAVVSQQSARLWIGRLRLDDWKIIGPGRTFDFPRTDKGKRLYCAVEGLCWLSDDTLVAVSDLAKGGFPGRCRGKDESIHIFRVP